LIQKKIYSGQCVGAIKEILPAKEVMRRLEVETTQILSNLMNRSRL